MRWLAVVVLLAGCDALFQIDELKQPPDDSRASTDSLIDTVVVDAPRDSGIGRARLYQVAHTLLDGTAAALTIPMPQLAGDLNVVFISWVGPNALTSVTDSAGNSYTNPTGTGAVGSTHQVLYYAHNINAGANQLTATFSSSVSMINIRLVEYTFVPVADPELTSNVSAGTSMTMQSATLTVNQPALLVAGFVSAYPSITPGPDYEERIDHMFGYVEDREVLAAGQYSATALQTTSGPYIAHIAAFRIL